MSLFGSLMGDVEDDPFFGPHMRHMRQMNNMMNSLFSDSFGMLGGEGPLALMGPRHGNAMMPFMPQMPNLNRLFSDIDGSNMHHIPAGSSYSSSTVVMSSGPGGKPQVYSATSSTKIGPHGIKETRQTMQDSRTGTKKMAIGHHIGERAHLIEREQNYYTGDAEERQEYINLDEEEAEEFDREFQYKASSGSGSRGRPAIQAPRREPQRLALPAPAVIAVPNPSVREVYSSSHPQRHHKHKQHKAHAPHSAHASHVPHVPQAAHASHAPQAAHVTHAAHASHAPHAAHAPQPAHAHRHSPAEN